MRGHGMTVIGDSVPEAVFRAIYTEMNARMQLQATQLEGPIEFLSDEEGRRSHGFEPRHARAAVGAVEKGGQRARSVLTSLS